MQRTGELRRRGDRFLLPILDRFLLPLLGMPSERLTAAFAFQDPDGV